jgi:hypothetical protein
MRSFQIFATPTAANPKHPASRNNAVLLDKLD